MYALIVEIHLPTPYLHIPQFLLPMSLLLTRVELCQHPPPSPSHGLLVVENVRGSVVSWEVSSGNGGSSARTVRDSDSGMSLVLDETSYTIENLRSSSTYRITVIVINSAGNVSSSFTHATAEGTPGVV